MTAGSGVAPTRPQDGPGAEADDRAAAVEAGDRHGHLRAALLAQQKTERRFGDRSTAKAWPSLKARSLSPTRHPDSWGPAASPAKPREH